MLKKPLFSIITPSYNCAEYLPRALNSVLQQTYQNFELIVVNDGSTDQTNEVVEKFLKDPRISYVRHLENRGVGPARNSAIREAKGEWIAIVDADNYLYPDALAKIVSLLPKLDNDVGVIFAFSETSHPLTREKRLTLKNPSLVGKIKFSDVVNGNIDGEYFSLCRREIMQKYLFDETLGTRRECSPLVWFAIARKYCFYIFNETLQYYETHRSSRISDPMMTPEKAHELTICHTKILDTFEDDFRGIKRSLVVKSKLRIALYLLLEGKKRLAWNMWLSSLVEYIHLESFVILFFLLLGQRGSLFFYRKLLSLQ